MKRIRFIKSTGTLVLPYKEITHYYVQPQEQFIEMFLPQDNSYIVVDEKEKADICFYSVQHDDESLLREDELNIFYSIENLRLNGERGGKYAYYNKFGGYGSKKTNIFIQNDESERFIQEGRLVIPVIECRLSYYNMIKDKYKEDMITPFKDKKFALMITQNNLNRNKAVLYHGLYKIDKVDSITDNIDLKSITCYNSIEILKLFNKYKFIVVCENSHTDGYITEKIFNVFLARSVAIYDGAPNISKYIKTGSYIPFTDNILTIVNKIKDNEVLYNNILNMDKIVDKYKDIKITY